MTKNEQFGYCRDEKQQNFFTVTKNKNEYICRDKYFFFDKG